MSCVGGFGGGDDLVQLDPQLIAMLAAFGVSSVVEKTTQLDSGAPESTDVLPAGVTRTEASAAATRSGWRGQWQPAADFPGIHQ